MTYADVESLLKSTGIPVYRDDTAGAAVKTPYLVYLAPSDTPVAADIEVMADWHQFRVELYTRRFSPSDELKVRAALNATGIVYTVSRVIPEERLYETIFEFEGIEVRDA